MSVNKNFVVKNGFEASTNLIVADAVTRRVGVGTTVAIHTLHVNGGIGATTLVVSGISTLQQLNVSGISTLGITTATNLTLQQLNVSGISTLGITTATNLTLQQLNVSGISTFSNIFLNGYVSAGNTFGQANQVLVSTGVGVTWKDNVSGISTLSITTLGITTATNTQTLTNKSIAAGSNTITGLTNTNLSGSAGISNTNLANSTISGIALGDNLFSLSFGSGIVASSSYNGSTAVTISSVAAGGTSINTANTIVARDGSGDFTAGSITATQYISTSDISLKENVITIKNALEKVLSLRGVEYDRIDSGDHQIGVIAQEVEKVVPAVVYGDEIKSVAYANLVGLLIEAIKEQQVCIEELERKSNA